MINHDLHYIAFLSDLLAQQDFLEQQAERLTLLLDEIRARLTQNADLIQCMELLVGEHHEKKGNTD